MNCSNEPHFKRVKVVHLCRRYGRRSSSIQQLLEEIHGQLSAELLPASGESAGTVPELPDLSRRLLSSAIADLMERGAARFYPGVLT